MINEWRQYRKIERGEHLVIGCDLSAGLGDYSCAQFLSKSHLDVPLVYHSPKIATEMITEIQPVLEKLFDITKIKPLIAPERNAGGVYEAERLSKMNYNNKYEIYKMPQMGLSEEKETLRLGFDTNSATRPIILTSLKEAIDKQLIRIYDKATIDELFSFVVVRTSAMVKAKAEVNAHDDLIMSLAIAYHLHIITPLVKLDQLNEDIMARDKQSRFEAPIERLRFYS